MDVTEMVEYCGITGDLPSLPPRSCFKQFSLQGELHIDALRPGIGHITKLMSEIIINNTRIIKTPEIISEEGYILTGRSMAVSGELSQKIEYTSDTQPGAVNVEYFSIPFISYIALPKSFPSGAPASASGYIENIFTELTGERTIFESAIILLVVEY